MEMDEKWEKLHRKIYHAVAKGKLGFTENMDLKMAKINLDNAVKLEEYEAAKVFKDFIDKN